MMNGEFVCGQMVTDSDGVSTFVPGEIVGDEFVPGIYVVDPDTGESSFVPGMHIETDDGTVFVEGRMVTKGKRKKRKVKKEGEEGVMVEEDEEEEEDFEPMFVPGRTSEDGKFTAAQGPTDMATRETDEDMADARLDGLSSVPRQPRKKAKKASDASSKPRNGIMVTWADGSSEFVADGCEGGCGDLDGAAEIVPGRMEADGSGFVPGLSMELNGVRSFIPGRIVKDPKDGTETFVPGKEVKGKDGNKFVCGQASSQVFSVN